MNAETGARLAFAVIPALLALSACNNTAQTLNPREVISQGYVLDEQSLELVPPGSSREQVILALGSPTTTATFDNEVLYYISQKRVRSAAFAQARLVEQRILAVYFGPDNRVASIANYGLQDGKVFDFISKTTPTGGKDLTFLGQLLAGVGKAPPSGVLGGG